MMDNKWKGTEYKRNDYEFPRTSREVYGRQLSREDFEEDYVTPSHNVHWGDVAVGVVACAVFVYLLIFGWGV
jgi:hypothetical protein